MSFSRVIKLTIGALLIATNPVLAAAAISRLPKGCEDYRLIHGNPDIAKIFILGEDHDTCAEAKIRCSEAIAKTKKAKKTSTAILFEHDSFDRAVSCKDKKVDKISAKCSGWNIKREDRLKQTMPLIKNKAIRSIFPIFEDVFIEIMKNEPTEQQTAAAINYLTDFISSTQDKIEPLKSASNPSIQDVNLLTLYQYQVDQTSALKNKVAQSNHFSTKLLSDLHRELLTVNDQAKSYFKDSNVSIKIPNQHLFSTIQEKAKANDLVIAYAGDAHVNKNCRGTQHPEIVQDLYDSLEQYADENPFAVLSCNL